MSIEFIAYQNNDAVKLTISHYSAVICYGRGCNLAEFNDIAKNLALLHYPESEDTEEYATAPQRFGSAILFPPNKLTGGSIHWNNQLYNLKANHIPGSHGLLKEFPFELVSSIECDSEITVRFRFISTDSVYYSSFGWNFACCFTFTLSKDGITQIVSFENNGTTEIPFGLGFHTAFRIPQNDCFGKEDYHIMVTSDKQWELDEHGFPNGKLVSTNYNYNAGNVLPLAEPIAEHIQSATLNPAGHNSFHGARIRNLKTNTELIYETDPVFANWMIWNKNASDNFICIEPMTCIIDAPNRNVPQNLHGFISLKPNQHWEAKNRLYVKY